MGCRTDKAYADESRARYRAWKASLPWREYLRWQLKSWEPFLWGAATGVIMFGAVTVVAR